MREIIFRGRRTVGVKHVWVYGNLIQQPHGEVIFIEDEGEDYEVDPTTVGQYVGIDSDVTHHGQGYGVKVFQGDIVDPHADTKYSTPMKVAWSNEKGGWELKKAIGRPCAYIFGRWIKECKVVGNIHENPELLK